MTKEQATSRGYRDTYRSTLMGLGEVEKFREELKRQGYKTVLVSEKVSQYSRSMPGSTYKCVYAEQRYFDDRRKAEILKTLSMEAHNKAEMLAEYEKKVADYDNRLNMLREELKNLG